MIKKLLLLDLDETLVDSDDSKPRNKDYTFTFHISDKYWGEKDIYTKVRPHVDTFLETMSQHYEIAIYTSGVKPYAEGVVAKLDPERKFISNIYSREHCAEAAQGRVKEVSKLGRSLKDVVMVDDYAGSLSFDIDNFVPILNFINRRKNDTELLELSPFLIYLKDFEDIREPLKKYFRWDIIDKYEKLGNRR